MVSLVDNLGVWGFNVAFWASITFLVSISIIWPWWKSSWGANIVLLELGISLALLPGVFSYDFGVHISTIAGGWVDVAALWLIAVIIVWRGGMIIIEQLRGARKRVSANRTKEESTIK